MSAIKEHPILKDRFELKAALSRGAQGTTWRGIDRQTEQPVIVKTLDLSDAEDWKTLELFERQAQVLRQLDHPQIPAYIDAFQSQDGQQYHLVQAQIPGELLDTLVDQNRPEATRKFDESKLVDFLRQMLDILDYLGELRPPVVHRDINPSSIILDPQGRYHLIDFGAVQNVLRAEHGGSTMVGTTGYMPPEQLVGKAAPASDIYALAATAVALASGLEPGQIPIKRMKLQIAEVLDLPDYLVVLLDQMLEPTLEHRLCDTQAIRQALNTQNVPARLRVAAQTSRSRQLTGALTPAGDEVRALMRLKPDAAKYLRVSARPNKLVVRSLWRGFSPFGHLFTAYALLKILSWGVIAYLVFIVLAIFLVAFFVETGYLLIDPNSAFEFTMPAAALTAIYLTIRSESGGLLQLPRRRLSVDQHQLTYRENLTLLSAESQAPKQIALKSLSRCIYHPNEQRLEFLYTDERQTSLNLTALIAHPDRSWPAPGEQALNASCDWLYHLIKAQVSQTHDGRHIEWNIHD